MADEKIAGPYIEATLDTKQMAAGAEQGAKAIDQVVASAVKLKNNLDPAERGISGLTAKLRALSPEAATQKLERLAVATDRVGGASIKGAAQIEFLQSRIAKLTAQGGTAPESLLRFAGAADQAGMSAQKLAGLVSQVAGSGGLSSVSRAAGAASLGLSGTTAAIGLTAVAGVGLGVAATKVAVDFEAAFARVTRVVTPAHANIDDLRQGIIDMSTRIPVSAGELANITSMAGQMGIVGTANLLKFTETVARLGVTADMSGEEAAKMLARIAQVNNIPIDKIDHLASAVLGVGAKSNATTDEILRMTMQMQQLGAGAGLTASEMIGLSATLAAGGVRVESAGTAMGRMARDINTAVAGASKDSATKLQELAHVSGMSAQQFKEAWSKDKSGVLLELFKGLQDEGDKASHALELLGWNGVRVAGSAGVLAKTTGDLRDNIHTANDEMANNVALSEQSEKIFGTTASKVTTLKGSFEALGIALGEGPGKALGAIIEQFTQLLNMANKGGLGDFLKSPARLAAATVTAGASEIGMATYNGVADYTSAMWGSMTGQIPSKALPLSPMRTNAMLGFDPLATGFQVAPSGHVAGAHFGAPEPLSKEQERALSHYQTEKIKLEEEYQKALANTKVGVESVVDRIKAWADAERARIEKDKLLSPAQKKEFEKKVTDTQNVKTADAEADEARKRREKAITRLAEFEKNLGKAAEQAAAREGEGIQRTLNGIEAKTEGYRDDLAAIQDLTAGERKEAEDAIDDYERISKSVAEADNATRAYQTGIEAVAQAQRNYKQALQSTEPTLERAIELIDDEYNHSVDALNHKLRVGEIDEANYRKAIAFEKQLKELKEGNARLQALVALTGMVSSGFDKILGSVEALIQIGPEEKRVLDGVSGALHGVSDFAQGLASNNPFEMISGGIEALGGLLKMFGGESEVERVGRVVGQHLGISLSESIAKTLVETMDKLHVSEDVAAALNFDKILQDNPGINASSYVGMMVTLVKAVADGSVPAKVGIEALGKNFNELKKEAEGGSDAARQAMVSLMHQAKELGVSVPEIQEAMRVNIKKAADGLSDLFGGQGRTQRGGKVFGGVDDAQAAANLTIFDAVFKGAEAFNGLFDAVEANKEAFEKLTTGLPAGTKLTGGAADFARVMTAMKDPLFAGAARTGKGAGQAFAGLRDSDSLTQGAVDAFGVTLQNNMAQAGAGLAGMGLTEEEQRHLQEEANLPLLVEMQHARAAGMKLDPKTLATLDQAQTDGMLPALSIAEQSLQVQKEMLATLRGTGGAQANAPANGNTGSVSTGGAGSANGVPHMADGGRIAFSPGGRLVLAGEKEDEFFFPKSSLVSGRAHAIAGDLGINRGSAGGVSVSAPAVLNVYVPHNLDPAAVGRAVMEAYERDLVPRLKTATKTAVMG